MDLIHVLESRSLDLMIRVLQIEFDVPCAKAAARSFRYVYEDANLMKGRNPFSDIRDTTAASHLKFLKAAMALQPCLSLLHPASTIICWQVNVKLLGNRVNFTCFDYS